MINIEAQKKWNPGYEIVTRGIFYCARMISGQKHTEFEHSDQYLTQKQRQVLYRSARIAELDSGSLSAMQTSSSQQDSQTNLERSRRFIPSGSV